MDNYEYCPDCGSGDGEGNDGHAIGCGLRGKWPTKQATSPQEIAMNKQNDVGGVDALRDMVRRLARHMENPYNTPAIAWGIAGFNLIAEAEALLASPVAEPVVSGWIPVSERLPESGKKVLAYYKNSNGQDRRVRAFYAEKFAIEASGDSDFTEYDESTDYFFLPAGWHEAIDNWDDYTSAAIYEGEVTHWQPLPSPPAIAKQSEES